MNQSTTLTNFARFADEQEAAFLAEHPEISDAVPSWADDVLIKFDAVDTSNTVGFSAERVVGEFSIEVGGTYQGGEVSLQEPTVLWFPADHRSERTGGELAAYARSRAVELLTIAAMLEAEDAS